MSRLDWALLRSFLAVIETGSLSGAATQIGTTQPTLSRHIRELETILGMSLFSYATRQAARHAARFVGAVWRLEHRREDGEPLPFPT